MIKDFTPLSQVIAHFDRVDPRIAQIMPTVNFGDWFEDHPSEDHFFNLTRNIIYQQLAGKAASTIFGRFEKLIGGKVGPEQVLQFDDLAFRDVGLSWAKAKYVRDLATKVASREIDLTKLSIMSDEEVIAQLTRVKGIGRWTAEMFLLGTLHRENIFSYGDLGLKNGFAKLYGVTDPKPSDIEQVINVWEPYKSYGSICLWHFLDNR